MCNEVTIDKYSANTCVALTLHFTSHDFEQSLVLLLTALQWTQMWAPSHT